MSFFPQNVGSLSTGQPEPRPERHSPPPSPSAPSSASLAGFLPLGTELAAGCAEVSPRIQGLNRKSLHQVGFSLPRLRALAEVTASQRPRRPSVALTPRGKRLLLLGGVGGAAAAEEEDLLAQTQPAQDTAVTHKAISTNFKILPKLICKQKKC